MSTQTLVVAGVALLVGMCAREIFSWKPSVVHVVFFSIVGSLGTLVALIKLSPNFVRGLLPPTRHASDDDVEPPRAKKNASSATATTTTAGEQSTAESPAAVTTTEKTTKTTTTTTVSPSPPKTTVTSPKASPTTPSRSEDGAKKKQRSSSNLSNKSEKSETSSSSSSSSKTTSSTKLAPSDAVTKKKSNTVSSADSKKRSRSRSPGRDESPALAKSESALVRRTKQASAGRSPAKGVFAATTKDLGNVSNKSPSHRRQRSEGGGGSRVVGHRRQNSNTSARAASEADRLVVHEGYCEVRSDHGLKHRWTRRYLVLKSNGWLTVYVSDLSRWDQCVAHVYLADATLDTHHIKKNRVTVVSPKHQALFHSRIPDDMEPQANDLLFSPHRKSRHLRMRTNENINPWVKDLQHVIHTMFDTDLRPEPITEELSRMSGDETSQFVSDSDLSDGDGPLTETNVLSDEEEEADDFDESETTQTEEEESDAPPVDWDSDDKLTTSVEDLFEGRELFQLRRRLSRAESFLIEDPNGDGPQFKSRSDAKEAKGGLLQILKNAVGMDLTRIAIPISFCEPTTFLQRLCEVHLFYDLLDKAANASSSLESLAYVTLFATSYNACNTRVSKPLNPLLGETYEYVDGDKFKFIAEQVSHHPPISACHAHNDKWEIWREQGVRTKFGGNSLDVSPIGRSYLRFKKNGHYFDWNPLKCRVSNIIIGSVWVDQYGEMKIENHNTGEYAILEFERCGWTGSGHYSTNITVYDKEKKARVQIKGKWIDRLTLNKDDGGLMKGFEVGDTLWENSVPKKVEKTDDNPHKLPPFALKLNEVDEELRDVLPPTDSRLRPDRLSWERGDGGEADSRKVELEEMQRDRRKKREGANEEHKPRFFKLEERDGFEQWVFNGKYWDDRKKRVQLAHSEK